MVTRALTCAPESFNTESSAEFIRFDTQPCPKKVGDNDRATGKYKSASLGGRRVRRMTIVTRRRTGEFTTVPNEIANDERLSFEARGLLIYLLSKPDNWQLNIQDIRRAGSIGRDKAYRLLRDLQTAGYIIAEEQSRDADTNQFTRANYIVYDCIEQAKLHRSELESKLNSSVSAVTRNQYRKAPHTENTDTGKINDLAQKNPYTENTDTGVDMSVSSQQTPYTENTDTGILEPHTENPYTENTDALIKDIYNNNTPQTPQAFSNVEVEKKSFEEERKSRSLWGRENKIGKIEAEALFENLWLSWPQNLLPDSKMIAASVFKKLNEFEQQDALDAVDKYLRWMKAQKKNPLLIVYLQEKKFKDFAGSVEIDEQGYFVIKRGTHEWDLWREWWLKNNGAESARRLNTLPSLQRATRFPVGYEPDYAK